MITSGNTSVDYLSAVMNILPANLERVLNSLAVTHLTLSTTTIDHGPWRVTNTTDTSGILYVLSGAGWLDIGGSELVRLERHTLVIMPARSGRANDTQDQWGGCTEWSGICGLDAQAFTTDDFRASTTADGAIAMGVVYGNFRADYDGSTDIFSTLSMPMVEQFSDFDGLEGKLYAVLAELGSDEVGAATMASAGFKQILISALRRALESTNRWAEDFAMLGNPRIARAVVAMQSNPGACHTVGTLAQIAGLSRSGFMARFKQHIGASPISVLRDIRMRNAAALLLTGNAAVSEAMIEAGYMNKDSFERAFRRAFGCAPANYRVR
jgi:AraC family transcriptional activator of mtrCDE